MAVADEPARAPLGPAWMLELVPDGGRADVTVLRALHAAGVAVTRSALARAFAAGQVRADDRPLRPAVPVHVPLRVEVTLVAPRPLRAEPEAIPLVVVYEDDALVVIDKPAGMAVHAGAGHEHGTLVNAVLGHLGVGPEALPVLPGNDATRPGIVHRLDKDTSGLLVVAKHAAAQEHLAAQFRRHTIDRAYLGVVHGVPSWAETRLETGHGRDPADRRRFSPDVGGRRAITRAVVQQPLCGAAVVRFVLHTGRTHQIRMHARKLGHPILGDRLYGHAPADPRVREAVAALGRHALHAAELGFVHPDGRALSWTSPLPVELASLVAALVDA